MATKNRLGITLQLTLLACGTLIAAVLGMSLLAYNRASSALEERWTEDLQSRVKLVESQLNTFDTTAKVNADRLSKIFENMIGRPVAVDPARTIKVGEYNAPAIGVGGNAFNMNFDEVDSFSRLTGGAATVFVRMGDDFLRVTTSLKKEDGSRALGTMLGKSHAGYETVMAGNVYLGRANLFGRDYMTKYSPVKDDGGKVVGILFVGFDITEGIGKLRDELSASRIGETGHYFVLDASKGPNRGVLAQHHELQGKNVLTTPGLEGYAQVLDARTGSLEKDGKLFVFLPFDPWYRVFGITIDASELHLAAAAVRNQLILFGLLVAVLGCVATYWVLSRKLQPLQQLAEDAARLGAGDLTVRAKVSSADEVGQLATAFNKMAEQVSELVVRLKRAAESVRGAVSQVQDASCHVSQGSDQQSEAASRAAAALEQVTASLQGVSESAQASRRLSEQTNDLSSKGEAVALRAADETSAIAAAVRESADMIGALNLRSEQITQVVKVIKDIADQTNLLALNAAIEAARAGEQGRGFAVVADEVRKLAERTSQATVEIGGMIASIQSETSSAVASMGTGSERVEQGVRLVREAVEALNEIRRAAGESLAKAAEISAAMQEQSQASSEIAHNVESIAAMADENSACAQRNQQTVANLDSLAAELTALTSGLRVSG